MAVDVGQAAPDFTLHDTDLKARSLSEFKGRNVVLAFFPGTFTGPCTTEMCAIRDQADQFNSLNAQVLAISVDAPFSQKAWAEANGLSFPLVSDFGRKVVNQYGVAFPDLAGLSGYVSANRAVFVLDKAGVVRYKWVANVPSDQPDLDTVKQELSQLGG